MSTKRRKSASSAGAAAVAPEDGNEDEEDLGALIFRECQLRKAEAADAEALTAAKSKDLRTPSRKRIAIAAAGVGIAQSMASLQATFLE
eukprot:scaffold5755_cov143-Skeletonema_marinoi.AAC.8